MDLIVVSGWGVIAIVGLVYPDYLLLLARYLHLLGRLGIAKTVRWRLTRKKGKGSRWN